MNRTQASDMSVDTVHKSILKYVIIFLFPSLFEYHTVRCNSFHFENCQKRVKNTLHSKFEYFYESETF